MGQGFTVVQGTLAESVQTLPLVHNPVVIESRQQLSPKNAEGALQRSTLLLRGRKTCRGLERCFEISHVRTAGNRTETDIAPVGDEDSVGRNIWRLQLPAQRRKGDAEVVTTGVEISVRPKQVDQLFAGM